MPILKFDQRGISIVEGLVAAGLVAFTALGASILIYIARSGSTNVSNTSCVQLARSSLARIQALMYRPSVDNYVLMGSDKVGSPNSGTELYGIANSVRWPATPGYRIYQPSATKTPYLMNSNLINGSIVALQQLYNSNIQFCSNPQGLPYSGTATEPWLVAQNQANMTNAQTYLRIQPYNPSTQTSPNCLTPPIFIRPPSRLTTPSSVGTAFNYLPNSHNELGFMATVSVNYQDALGTAKTCSVSEPFVYYRDDGNPVNPTALITTTLGARANCDFSSFYVTIQSYYPNVGSATTMEAGSVQLCKDKSYFNNTNTQLCDYGGPTLQTGKIQGSWTTCDQVTVCGVSPTSATGSTDAYGGTVYNLRYDNLPWTCNAVLQFAAVDVAGNSKSVTSPPIFIQPPACNSCADGTTYCGSYKCKASGGGGGGGGGYVK